MLTVVAAGPTLPCSVDRRLDDPLPGFRLLLGAALERIGPCHINFIALVMCIHY